MRQSAAVRGGSQERHRSREFGGQQPGDGPVANRDALAGPFPEEFELATDYSLWHRSDISPAVEDFIAMLISPAGREKLVEEGLMSPTEP